MSKLVLLFLVAVTLMAKDFLLSVGGFDVCHKKLRTYLLNCPYSKRIPLYKVLPKELPNINSITIWITRDWKENWYPALTINRFIAKGYTPVFIFYFFADDISKSYVKKQEKAYFKTLKRFIRFLNKIKGKKLVVLNPEYNENGVESWKYMDYLNVRSIALLKGSVKNVEVGICPGDFGEYKKLWDTENWDLYIPSMRESAKVSDFIAFQEMRALTRNKKEEIRKTPLRTLAFASYLYQTYHKPTYLAYAAISSYKDEKLQQEVFKGFKELLPLFKHVGHMRGFGVFHYIDVPNHKGYFNEAEKYFGLKNANGIPKPSFFEFRKMR